MDYSSRKKDRDPHAKARSDALLRGLGPPLPSFQEASTSTQTTKSSLPSLDFFSKIGNHQPNRSSRADSFTSDSEYEQLDRHNGKSNLLPTPDDEDDLVLPALPSISAFTSTAPSLPSRPNPDVDLRIPSSTVNPTSGSTLTSVHSRPLAGSSQPTTSVSSSHSSTTQSMTSTVSGAPLKLPSLPSPTSANIPVTNRPPPSTRIEDDDADDDTGFFRSSLIPSLNPRKPVTLNFTSLPFATSAAPPVNPIVYSSAVGATPEAVATAGILSTVKLNIETLSSSSTPPFVPKPPQPTHTSTHQPPTFPPSFSSSLPPSSVAPSNLASDDSDWSDDDDDDNNNNNDDDNDDNTGDGNRGNTSIGITHLSSTTLDSSVLVSTCGSHSTGSTDSHPMHSPLPSITCPSLCDNCESVESTVVCVECNESYCDSCNRVLHLRASKKGHRRRTLPMSRKGNATGYLKETSQTNQSELSVARGGNEKKTYSDIGMEEAKETGHGEEAEKGKDKEKEKGKKQKRKEKRIRGTRSDGEKGENNVEREKEGKAETTEGIRESAMKTAKKKQIAWSGVHEELTSMRDQIAEVEGAKEKNLRPKKSRSRGRRSERDAGEETGGKAEDTRKGKKPREKLMRSEESLTKAADTTSREATTTEATMAYAKRTAYVPPPPPRPPLPPPPPSPPPPKKEDEKIGREKERKKPSERLVNGKKSEQRVEEGSKAVKMSRTSNKGDEGEKKKRKGERRRGLKRTVKEKDRNDDEKNEDNNDDKGGDSEQEEEDEDEVENMVKEKVPRTKPALLAALDAVRSKQETDEMVPRSTTALLAGMSKLTKDHAFLFGGVEDDDDDGNIF